jgi:CDP-4-dehydro-6-deoxyglucose reductase, E1
MQDNAPFPRDGLLKYLNDKKIGTRLLFGGNLLRQPYMKDRPYRVHGETTNSDKVMRDTFWIGVFPGLGKAENDYIIETIGNFISKDYKLPEYQAGASA